MNIYIYLYALNKSTVTPGVERERGGRGWEGGRERERDREGDREREREREREMPRFNPFLAYNPSCLSK